MTIQSERNIARSFDDSRNERDSKRCNACWITNRTKMTIWGNDCGITKNMGRTVESNKGRKGLLKSCLPSKPKCWGRQEIYIEHEEKNVEVIAGKGNRLSNLRNYTKSMYYNTIAFGSAKRGYIAGHAQATASGDVTWLIPCAFGDTTDCKTFWNVGCIGWFLEIFAGI